MSGEGPTSMEVFQRLRILAGRVVEASPFPEARNPALRLRIEFGPGVGVLSSSARLTRRYSAETLVGTRVLALVNLPPLRVAGFRSECLVLGLVNPEDPDDVVLVRPDDAADMSPGWRLG
jgi:tRNA-binding protein